MPNGERAANGHEQMKRQLKSHYISIPEIDAFLSDYRAVCRKHRMMIVKDIDLDGGSYLTLGPWDGRADLDLNLDEAHDLPCVTRACKEIEGIRRRESDRKAKAHQRAIGRTKPGDALALLEAALPYLDRYEGIEDLRLRVAATIKNGRK